MRAVIFVSLPNEMTERLNELVDASGRAKSEIVKEALRRYLWEERFDALRLRLGKKARTRGLVPESAATPMMTASWPAPWAPAPTISSAATRISSSSTTAGE